MNKLTKDKKHKLQRQYLIEVCRNHAKEAADQLLLLTNAQLTSTAKHSIALEEIRNYICPDLHPSFQQSGRMVDHTLLLRHEVLVGETCDEWQASKNRLLECRKT